MAAADIEKFSVYDPRVYSKPSAYAVEKGSLSLTNSVYKAISATASQHNFNITVPSQNVFVDRAIQWTSYFYLSFTVPSAGLAGVVGDPVVQFGRDCALTALPLHSMVQTSQASINDTSVILNTSDVLLEILRLTDYKRNRMARTAPTMLDRYGSYNDAYQAVNSPLASYLDFVTEGEMPNGAWADIQFVDANGAPLGAAAYVSGGVTVNTVLLGGQYYPVRTLQGGGAEPASYPIFVKCRSSENLVLSPLIFADGFEYSTGLFGINAIQVVLNMKSDVSRVLRYSTGAGRVLQNVALYSVQGSPFSGSELAVQFLTPSLDLQLPAKSSIPFQQFPRYITTNQGVTIAAGAQTEINSSTVTLPSIPDSFIIYCKPAAYADATNGDWYLPITNVNITLDNYSGILNNHNQYQLFRMSQHNGLEMTWDEWRGQARDGANGSLIQTVGGFLVLRPGTDIPLQAGVAAGVLGNFAFQIKVTVQNTSSAAVTNPVLFIITVNSGFFESMAGSSRLVLNPLSEADVISAPDAGDRTSVSRLVGHGFLGKLGSMFSKAMDIYSKAKPVISAAKSALPEGRAKETLGKLGFGMAGSAMPSGGRKMTLSERLM
jgi:hypothetical protein